MTEKTSANPHECGKATAPGNDPRNGPAGPCPLARGHEGECVNPDVLKGTLDAWKDVKAD